jgi:DNA-directed RNA polymerase specialized sigma24 family protein
MKITEPTAELLRAATGGDMAALDALLAHLQPGVYNLAVRVLGNATTPPMPPRRCC